MQYLFVLPHFCKKSGKPAAAIKIHVQRNSRAWKFSFQIVVVHRILDPAFVSVRLGSIGVSVARE